MGQTIRKLASRQISDKTVFNNRFVMEVCETFHIHYRNLRILMNQIDFHEFCHGVIDGYSRWCRLQCPPAGEGHLELCRKAVARDPVSAGEVQINLNRNLYPMNGSKIYSEGADFHDPEYIHLKIQDQRLELSKDDFLKFAEAVRAAELSIKNNGNPEPEG